MFPSDYPKSPILFELKSKTLSLKLLDGLTRVTEQECKKEVGKPQILFATKFINKFIEDNPLCCCSEEINTVKKLLGPDDLIKLSQKSSSVILTINKENYFLKCKIVIPDNYPKDKVDITLVDCNFPRVFKAWFVENAKELARRCVEAPLKPKPNAPPFVPKPSMEPAVSFLVKSVQRYHGIKYLVLKTTKFDANIVHFPKNKVHERIWQFDLTVIWKNHKKDFVRISNANTEI